jgi:putative flippase GtrA
MPPDWLTILAWISLAGGFLSAGAIAYDIYRRGMRQPMRVMEAVWPITGLYLGPGGWFAYGRLGRPTASRDTEAGGEKEIPEWQGVAVSATHCGAGCTLGDIIGEWVVFAGSLTIAGAALWPAYMLDFALAYLLGIVFQYFAIKPMSDLTRRQAVWRAIRADTLSLVAFEIGLFGWMALVFFVLFPGPHLTPGNSAYWLMMQIGMALGLLTTYPVNIWLVRRGIKHPMVRPVVPAAVATRALRQPTRSGSRSAELTARKS